jgi:hypothetical protein
MKKIIIPIICILLFSCTNNSATTANNWTKETAAKKCFDAATKDKYDLDQVALTKLHAISDCVGEKMVAQFKTEQEANDKPLDAAAIANECKDEYEKKSIGR